MALKIEDYAMIGDCKAAAMVGRDGSIDWLCWPRFEGISGYEECLDDLTLMYFACVNVRSGDLLGLDMVHVPISVASASLRRSAARLTL